MQARINENRMLIIPFNEEYDVPEECNVFKVTRKRSYNKLLEVIIEVMDILFNKKIKVSKKNGNKLIDSDNVDLVEKICGDTSQYYQ